MDTMDSELGTCDVCGEALPEGAYFCGECGSSVPEFGAPPRTSSLPVTPPASTIVDSLVPEVIVPQEIVPQEIVPQEIVPEALAPEVTSPEAVLSEPSALQSVAPETALAVRPFMLVFSTGERAQVVGRGLIGRMPVASPGDAWDHLIVVNDPSKTVSKTHLQVEAAPEGLVVTDLASANGTVVSLPGIAAERLAPHVRVILTPGTSVGIGDQSFTIE